MFGAAAPASAITGNYVEDNDTIVAVTSFGMNAYCRGVDSAYGTDTADVVAWMESVLSEEKFEQIEFVTI